MNEVRFYSLSVTPLSKGLPKLLEKVLEKNTQRQIILYSTSGALLKSLDDVLWTYTPMGFLPHGLDTEPEADEQPILLSQDQDQIVADKICVCLDPIDLSLKNPLSLIYMFESSNTPIFRGLAEAYKKNKVPILFMAQDADGGWQTTTP